MSPNTTREIWRLALLRDLGIFKIPTYHSRSKSKYCFSHRNFRRHINKKPPIIRDFYRLFNGHVINIAHKGKMNNTNNKRQGRAPMPGPARFSYECIVGSD
jgi:hypothetical protein